MATPARRGKMTWIWGLIVAEATTVEPTRRDFLYITKYLII
jgi:hypothetical protein